MLDPSLMPFATLILGGVVGYFSGRAQQRYGKKQDRVIQLYNLLTPMRKVNYASHNLKREDEIRGLADFCNKRIQEDTERLLVTWHSMAALERHSPITSIANPPQPPTDAERLSELRTKAGRELDSLLAGLRNKGR